MTWRALYLFIPLMQFLLSCNKNNLASENPAGGDPLPPVEITDRVLTENLTLPWELAWGNDNLIWMTEKPGRISRVNPVTGTVTNLLTIPDVSVNGEGGLLGMVFHPDFKNNPFVYVSYNYNSSNGYRLKVVRYTFDGTALKSPLILIDNIPGAGIHNGSRLVIVKDKIFITTGDANNTSLPQNNSSLAGKVLRLNLDGSIPADNPFSGSPIWTSGHRNPQGLVYANNILYSSEHGPASDDEVNIIEKGRNYGWPDVLGFCDASELSTCNSRTVREPISAWTPTIAVSGMDYYDKDLIPQWKNSLLLATLKNSRLMQLRLDATHLKVDSTFEYFNGTYGRLRDIAISPEGKVFFCTSNGSNDKIVVVEKK